MAEQKSFKERVKDTVIQNANSYKRYFVDYEYLPQIIHGGAVKVAESHIVTMF